MTFLKKCIFKNYNLPGISNIKLKNSKTFLFYYHIIKSLARFNIKKKKNHFLYTFIIKFFYNGIHLGDTDITMINISAYIEYEYCNKIRLTQKFVLMDLITNHF